MRKLINKKTVWLTGVAAVLTVAMGIQGVMAYFTASDSASGGASLILGNTTELTEGFSNMTKNISVTNTGTGDCYVRVKVFHGSTITVSYSGVEGAWSQDGEEYFYYNTILAAGESTSQLNAAIVLPEDYEDNFNVVVVQECAPVQYAEDGSPLSAMEADWSQKFDTASENGEGVEQ